MTSPIWFILQVVLTAIAAAAVPWVSRQKPMVWKTVAGAAFGALLLWPLMRVFPVAFVRWFGAETIAHLELTGQAVPAVLLFGILARHVPRKQDGRALLAVTLMAAVYFAKAGWWMVGSGVPDLGAAKNSGEDPMVAMQTTEYTCVAASMVTMLRAHGIETTETEMAQLANIEVGSGATDSRAILGLRRRLAGTGLVVEYQSLDLPGLIAAPKPVMVQLGWGYFTSHMVPVMDASEEFVVVGDPSLGKRKVPTENFLKQWKGQAIVVRLRKITK